jgi:hypothetical protein
VKHEINVSPDQPLYRASTIINIVTISWKQMADAKIGSSLEQVQLEQSWPDSEVRLQAASRPAHDWDVGFPRAEKR